MAYTDFNKSKPLDVPSVTGTPTISKAVPIKIVGNDDTVTGTGDIVIDWTNISDKTDIAIYDENENLLDYYFEKFDTSNNIAVAWVYRDWVRDGTTQVQVAYGSGTTDNEVAASTVFDKDSILYAQYLFNTSSGNVLDRTSNNNDSSAVSATRGSDGIIGNGFYLPNQSSDVEFDYQFWTQSTYTISVWAKPSVSMADQDDYFKFVHAYDSTNGASYWIAANGSNEIQVGFKDDSGNAYSTSGSFIPTQGEWFKATATYDGSNLKGFINGSEVTSLSTTATPATPTFLTFGRSAGGEYQSFEGYIDNYRFATSAEGSDIITALYDVEKSSQTFFNQNSPENTSTSSTTISVPNNSDSLSKYSPTITANSPNVNISVPNKSLSTSEYTPTVVIQAEPSDWGDSKTLSPTNITGTPTISKTVPIQVTDGSVSTTGTGKIEIDWTNISDKSDIAVFDSSGSQIDYWFEEFDTTNNNAVIWVYKDWVRDGTAQAQVCFGNGPKDLSASSPETVFSKEPNLNAQFLFNETSGDILDSSGNNYDATNNGASRGETGRFGNAIYTDGSSAYVDAPVLTTSDTFSISVWVKSPISPSNQEDWSKIICADGPNYFLQWDSDGDFVAGFDNSGTLEQVVSEYVASSGTWVRVTYEYDGSDLKIYVNGVEQSSASVSGATITDPTTFSFGAFASDSKQYGEQYIDNVRVVKSSESSDEISSLYDATKSSPDFFSQSTTTDSNVSISIPHKSPSTTEYSPTITANSPNAIISIPHKSPSISKYSPTITANDIGPINSISLSQNKSEITCLGRNTFGDTLGRNTLEVNVDGNDIERVWIEVNIDGGEWVDLVDFTESEFKYPLANSTDGVACTSIPNDIRESAVLKWKSSSMDQLVFAYTEDIDGYGEAAYKIEPASFTDFSADSATEIYNPSSKVEDVSIVYDPTVSSHRLLHESGEATMSVTPKHGLIDVWEVDDAVTSLSNQQTIGGDSWSCDYCFASPECWIHRGQFFISGEEHNTEDRELLIARNDNPAGSNECIISLDSTTNRQAHINLQGPIWIDKNGKIMAMSTGENDSGVGDTRLLSTSSYTNTGIPTKPWSVSSDNLGDTNKYQLHTWMMSLDTLWFYGSLTDDYEAQIEYWKTKGTRIEKTLDSSGGTVSFEFYKPYIREGRTINWRAVVKQTDGSTTTSSSTSSFTTSNTNMPPKLPMNPSPADGATGVAVDTTLSVDVYDEDGDTMDVSFYWDDGTLIEKVTGVSSGSTATTSSLSLNGNTTFNWYAVADDGTDTTTSETFSFTTEISDIVISIPHKSITANEYSTKTTTDSDVVISIPHKSITTSQYVTTTISDIIISVPYKSITADEYSTTTTTTVDYAKPSAPHKSVSLNKYNLIKNLKPKDFNKTKKLAPTSVTGTPTVSRAVPIKITSGDDTTTGTGELVLDWTNISGKSDICVFDLNDDVLDYYIEKFDTTNSEAVIWVYNDWVRDGTYQVKVSYGDGSFDSSTIREDVFSKESNLQGSWTLGEESGDAIDGSGNNNDGTVTASSRNVTGKVDGAISFESADEGVNFGNDSTLYPTKEHSIECWVKFDSPSGGMKLVDTGGFSLETRDVSGSIKFFGWFESQAVSYTENVTTTLEIQSDTWYHVVYTYDGSYTKLYVDGAEDDSDTAEGNIDYSTQTDFILNGQSSISDSTFYGDVDNYHFYNSGLTADEVTAKYDATKSSPDFFSQSDVIENNTINLPYKTTSTNTYTFYWPIEIPYKTIETTDYVTTTDITRNISISVPVDSASVDEYTPLILSEIPIVISVPNYDITTSEYPFSFVTEINSLKSIPHKSTDIEIHDFIQPITIKNVLISSPTDSVSLNRYSPTQTSIKNVDVLSPHKGISLKAHEASLTFVTIYIPHDTVDISEYDSSTISTKVVDILVDNKSLDINRYASSTNTTYSIDLGVGHKTLNVDRYVPSTTVIYNNTLDVPYKGININRVSPSIYTNWNVILGLSPYSIDTNTHQNHSTYIGRVIQLTKNDIFINKPTEDLEVLVPETILTHLYLESKKLTDINLKSQLENWWSDL